MKTVERQPEYESVDIDGGSVAPNSTESRFYVHLVERGGASCCMWSGTDYAAARAEAVEIAHEFEVTDINDKVRRALP